MISARHIEWTVPDGHAWWVVENELVVPAQIHMEATGLHGTPDMTMDFAVVNFEVPEAVELPELVDMHLFRSPDGRGLRSSDLSDLHVEDLVRTAFTLFAMLVDQGRPGPGPMDKEFSPFQQATLIANSDYFSNGHLDPLIMRANHGHPMKWVFRGLPDLGKLELKVSSRERAALNHLEKAFAKKRGTTPAELEQIAYVYTQHINENPTKAVEERFGLSRGTAARRVQQARAAGYLPETVQGKKKGAE